MINSIGGSISEPLTSCKGKMGGLPERPLKQGGPGVEGWVFVLELKTTEHFCTQLIF